jgi:KEOPS complex subunit Pcc1
MRIQDLLQRETEREEDLEVGLSTMLSATLRIDSPDSGTILQSLRPEAGRELPRTHIRVNGTADSVTVSIEANDATAMRAALNSYLGCIRITEEISRIAKVSK